MFYIVNSQGYLLGVCIGLLIIAVFCFYMAMKSGKKKKAMQEAIQRFEAMARGKTFDEVVAVMKKPQLELDKTCPNTGDPIKVAKWEGGMYYWEGYRYDIVAVFEEDGKFNNVKMFEK